MELSDLLVPEESVGHPDLADVGEGEIFDLLCKDGQVTLRGKEVRPHLSDDLLICA